MKLKKIEKGNYLLIKLNSRDTEYLRNFKKFEHPDTVKKADMYLSKILALHIKAVFVMTAAQLLKEEKIIKQQKYNLSLKELDKSLSDYERVVDKYFIKFGDMLDSKVFKKENKKGD